MYCDDYYGFSHHVHSYILLLGPGGRLHTYCIGRIEHDNASPADWLLAMVWKLSNSVNNILCSHDNVELLIMCFRIKVYCYYGNVYVTDSII